MQIAARTVKLRTDCVERAFGRAGERQILQLRTVKEDNLTKSRAILTMGPDWKQSP